MGLFGTTGEMEALGEDLFGEDSCRFGDVELENDVRG